jgi:hypothetical protein
VISALALAVLADGVDDWVPQLAIDGFARQLAISADKWVRRERIVDAVEELVCAGLVEVGNVTSGGFRTWSGSPEEWVARLRRALGVGNESDWEFAWWTSNTALGDSQGRGTPNTVEK